MPAAAAGPSAPEQGKEQFEKGKEAAFEWGDEHIWPGLEPEKRAQVVELLEEFRDVFAWSIYDLSDSAIEGVEFEVEFTDDKPIFSPRRRLSQYESDLLKAYCEEREAAKLIARLKLPPGVKEPNCAPTVMPRKKDAEGNWTERRICGDYRRHNDKTVPDKYPMPVADELFDDLGGSDCFSTLDLRMGYHQIRIRDGDQWKLAFWGHDDIYMPLRTPFGPKNAPALFQRLMDRVLRELREWVRAFIDDTIIHTKGFAKHMEAFRATLTQLRKYNIKVHPKKIRILFPEIPFLGHMVNPVGLKPQELKVAAIQRIPYPTNVTALKQLLGIIGYYRRFLQGCSTVARPLNDLLKKDVDFPAELNAECKAAIDQLKGMLCSAPLLVRPDPKREYELHTDWSAAGCGAILQQRDDTNAERVVAYASRSNNRAESNYSSYAGECLAAVWGVRYFRVYLYGVHFKLYTDHRPLEWLMKSPNLTGMHARWALMLQEFDFEIKYRKGLVNMNADGLSRSPLPETEDLTGARVHEDLPAQILPAAERAPAPATASALLAWQAWAADAGERPEEADIPTAAELGGEMIDDEAPDAPAYDLLPLPAPMDYGPPDVQLPVPADEELGGERARGMVDIWEDPHTLAVIAGGEPDPEWGEKECERARRRSRAYRFADGALLRQLADHEERIVPRPAERKAVVQAVHEETGHWGEKRTVHLLKRTYWWAGMYEDAHQGVAGCHQCDRTKASFAMKMSSMQSLPIMGLGYRWSLDFAGPLITSRSKKRFVLVAVEHFSKWCEVWPMPSKHAGRVAEAFLGVMVRFGACAEVLTDNGTEFEGEFDQLCQRLLIDHRTTTRYHPQSNGLTERLVRTIKAGITKFGSEADRRTWDEWLPYLVMGYRMSPQGALAGYSPYFIMFGRRPMLTGEAARKLLGEPVDFDDPAVWVQACEQRAEVLKREMPLALENLAAAQHRDQRRYEYVRKTGYRPRLRKFQVDDVVYLRRQPGDSTDLAVTRGAYRVHQIGSQGQLVLQGADGTLFKEHQENCAPCHNPNIDLRIDPTLTGVTAGHACQVCKSAGNAAKMLLCDNCVEGYHLRCLEPALPAVPAGVWLCPRCQEREEQRV